MYDSAAPAAAAAAAVRCVGGDGRGKDVGTEAKMTGRRRLIKSCGAYHAAGHERAGRRGRRRSKGEEAGGRVHTSSPCPGLVVLVLAGLLLRRGHLEGSVVVRRG